MLWALGRGTYDNSTNHHCVLSVFRRPAHRRLLHAGHFATYRSGFAGGAPVGLFGLGAIVLGNAFQLWRVPIFWTPWYFLALFYFGLAISVTPIYLVTWRLARRFGWRGLAVCLGVVAIISPPRDYFYAMKFPEWMVFAPGVAPIIADSLT